VKVICLWIDHRLSARTGHKPKASAINHRAAASLHRVPADLRDLANDTDRIGEAHHLVDDCFLPLGNLVHPQLISLSLLHQERDVKDTATRGSPSFCIIRQ
jgi:hypothetical protein